MTEKNKNDPSEHDILDAHAEEITKAVVSSVERLRKKYGAPNYLVEYIALRAVVDNYEHYLTDIIELGSEMGGVPSVGYS